MKGLTPTSDFFFNINFKVPTGAMRKTSSDFRKKVRRWIN